MKELNNDNLMNIKGGGIAFKTASIVTSIFVFIVGVIDGQIKLK